LSFGGYGLELAALSLVVFGAYDSYPVGAISTPREIVLRIKIHFNA